MHNNICGQRVRQARLIKKPFLSQNNLAAKMQLDGFGVTSDAISRIELRKRHVTDLELVALAKILNVSTAWLLEETDYIQL